MHTFSVLFPPMIYLPVNECLGCPVEFSFQCCYSISHQNTSINNLAMVCGVSMNLPVPLPTLSLQWSILHSTLQSISEDKLLSIHILLLHLIYSLSPGHYCVRMASTMLGHIVMFSIFYFKH